MPETNTTEIVTASSDIVIPPDAASGFDAALKRLSAPEGAASAEPTTTTETAPETATTEAAPVTETPPPDPIDVAPPPKLSKEAANNWQTMRDEAKKAREEAATLRRELEEAKKTPPKPDDGSSEVVKAAMDRAAKLESELERAAYERSSKHQKFLEDQKRSIETAKAYIEGTEINPNAIDFAAASAPGKRIGILRDAGLDTEQIGAVIAYLVDHDKTVSQKEAALSNHKEELAREQAQQAALKEREARYIAEQEDKVIATTAQRIQAEREAFKPVPGNAAQNAEAKALGEKAIAIVNGKMPLDQLVAAAHNAVEYEVIAPKLAKVTAELAAAKAQLAKLTAVQPGAGESNGQRPVAATIADNSDAAVASRFDARLGR